MKKNTAKGFTLIELIIVIAILAFVVMIGIHSYGNIREIQAKKMNLANIKRTYHALATYETINKEQGETGYFNGFEAMIDVAADGPLHGAAGEIDFGEWTITTARGSSVASLDARTANNSLGIYDGSWKVLGATYNAAGQGSGDVASLADAQEQNKGMRTTGLYKQLGLYYLSETDVTLLKDAGVSYVYYHNPSTQQAYGAANRNPYCSAVTEQNGQWLSADGLKIKSGGPGFRPDMSAFYPCYLTNGLPVAIISPTSSIYDDLGYDLGMTNAAPTEAEAIAAVASTKLIAFGIGKNSECVVNQIGLGEAPYNPVYDKKNYRPYVAVFVIKTGGQGVASTCRLAGVIDCAGNTYRAAEYGANWTTKIDN